MMGYGEMTGGGMMGMGLLSTLLLLLVVLAIIGLLKYLRK